MYVHIATIESYDTFYQSVLKSGNGKILYGNRKQHKIAYPISKINTIFSYCFSFRIVHNRFHTGIIELLNPFSQKMK